MKSLFTILLLGIFITSEAQNISQSQVRQFNAVPAYRVFGRGSGVGTPSFITLDSNHVPQLHSQSYYDLRYGSLSVQNTNTSNISANTTAIALKADKSTTISINGNSQTLGSNPSFTISGGNSSGTFGTQPATIGTLLNESFAGTSIPSGWTKGANLTATYNNKAIITGGTYWTIPAKGVNTTAWGSGMQFNTRRMPYEKMDVSMTIVPQTKSAGNMVAITKGSLDNAGNVTSYKETIAWDLSDAYTSGRTTIGADSLSSFTSSTDSSSRMQWNIGDTLVLYFHKEGWGLTAGILNKATGTRTIQRFSRLWNGSGGRWNFIFIKGTYHVLNVNASSFDRKGGVWFLGDSHTAGAGTTNEVRRFANQVFGSNTKYYGVWGLPSLSAKAAVSGGLISEMISDIQPSKVVTALGYNDETDPTGAPTYSQSLDSIVYPLQRAGITPYVLGFVPRQLTTDIYNDTAAALAARRGVTFFNIRPLLLNGGSTLYGGYNSDNTHVNNDAHTIIANVITATAGHELLSEVATDTTPVMKAYGLGYAQTEEVNRIVGLKSNGDLVAMPNYATKAGIGINNAYTIQPTTPKTVAQPTSLIHTSDEIRSNAFLQVSSSNGLRIGFNDDNSSSATGTNIDITNQGTGGNATPQGFATISGTRNILMGAVPKTNSAGSLSGSDNVGIGYNGGRAISTGNRNVEINIGSSMVTTGSDNIIIGGNVGASGGQTTASNAILLGTTAFYGWGNASNRIHIGYAAAGGQAAANEAVFAPANNTTNGQAFYFGGKTIFLNGANVVLRAPSSNVTSGVGTSFYIESGNSTGNSQPTGSINLRTASTTAYNTPVDRLIVQGEQTTLTTGLKMTSTTKGLIPPKVTMAQRDAMKEITSISVSGTMSGYVNGTAVTLTGGGGAGASAYVNVTSGSITSVTLVWPGSGFSSPPAATVATGTGAVLTVNIAIPDGTTVYCTDATATDGSAGVMQIYQASTSTWKNAW